MYKTDTVFVLSIRIEEGDGRDILSYHLDSLGVEAISEDDQGLTIHDVREDFLKDVKNFLIDNQLISQESVQLSSIKNENWNKKWEASFEPVIVRDFCVIRAGFHDKSPAIQHDIVINPEMAFGTGHHETTYMVLDQMSKINFTDKDVLDYGCGTAVLAILADQMNAKSIDAIDIDFQAVHCSEQNILTNHCTNINIGQGDLDTLLGGTYDVILANINRNVLLKNADELNEKLRENGLLLISGILKEDESLVVDTYKNAGFECKEIVQRGNWLCIHWAK